MVILPVLLNALKILREIVINEVSTVFTTARVNSAIRISLSSRVLKPSFLKFIQLLSFCIQEQLEYFLVW